MADKTSPFPYVPEMEECEICAELKIYKHIKGSYMADLHRIALESRKERKRPPTGNN